MQHSITKEGFGVRLRPVRLDDAPFIVWLRNLDHAKGHIGDSAQSIVTQEKWLQTYFKREGDYYFITETLHGIPVGTYGIYNVVGDLGESGRWVMRPEVPAAIPSIFLGFDAAFECLGLRLVKAFTVSSNHRVLSLNRKLGLKKIGPSPISQVIEGKPVQLIEFELSAQDWSTVRESLLPLASVAGDKIRWGEQNASFRDISKELDELEAV